MTTFELTIESAEAIGQRGLARADLADAKTLRMLVSAEHWVDAWQEGLAILGDPPDPQDASCVIDAATARIEVPSTGRLFVVRPLAKDPTGPRPRPGKPVVLTGADDGQGASIRVRRGGPSDLTVSDVPAAPSDDPVARVLSALERQRLGARPMRIDKHGMPQLIGGSAAGDASNGANGSGRRATPVAVPRHSVPETGRRQRPSEETLAFTPVAQGTPDALPQMFRPVVATGATDPAAPAARLALLQWAVDTAWSHVPCAVALLLDGLQHDEPEVALARGERERETRGCRVPLDQTFRQAACRAPTRVRFADHVTMRFVQPDGRVFEVEVESTLCAPVAFVPGDDGRASFGLGLVLLNAARPAGFTDSELRALTYLARTLAERLASLE